MPIQVALNHKTTYRYNRLVTLLPQVVRLRPAPHCRTPILSYSLRVEPHPHYLNWQQDPYSNHLARLVFPKPVSELRIEVDLVAEMTVINPFDFFVEEAAEKFPFRYDAILARELIPYLETEPAGPRLQALASELRGSDVRTVDYIVELNHRLHEKIRYIIRLEPGVQPCEQTLELGSGSCRDTGWLLVQLLRQLGLAARFVSGYLIQLKADVPALDGPSGTEVDFTDLHAWAEVYLPGAGWVGLDPTSGLLAGEATYPWPARPTRSPPRPCRARIPGTRTRATTSTTSVKLRSSITCPCSGSMKIRASPNPTPRSSGGQSSNWVTRLTSTFVQATFA